MERHELHSCSCKAERHNTGWAGAGQAIRYGLERSKRLPPAPSVASRVRALMASPSVQVRDSGRGVSNGEEQHSAQANEWATGSSSSEAGGQASKQASSQSMAAK